jgi:tRNA (guanine37-N1)-methyltransferase
MQIDILTLFPKMFSGPFQESLIAKAQKNGLAKINIHYLRDWAKDKHRTVDDRPFGGGPGMVLKAEPIFAAVNDLRLKKVPNKNTQVIFLTPQGQPFTQKQAETFSQLKQLILLCGHYEGVDQRIRDHLIDQEISIGDYVLTGGELPALVVTEAVVRLIPGVVGKPESLTDESFSQSLLDFPQYTQPADFQGMKVPQVLLSGDHQKIAQWRKAKAIQKTKKSRPDLFKKFLKNPK